MDARCAIHIDEHEKEREKPVMSLMGEWESPLPPPLQCAHVADQLAASTKIARDY